MGSRALVWLVLAVGTWVGCASTGFSTALDREAGSDVRPRWVGRPPETLQPVARAMIESALEGKGLLSEVPLPGELRLALIEFQELHELAPTGWVDADTVAALGLDPVQVLPIEAGAGAKFNEGPSELIQQVGGEPGPASMPPTAVDVGAAVVEAPGDPAFHLAEAKRLRAAAMELRGKASRLGEGAEFPLRKQADKALYVARLHARAFEGEGGEGAIAGVAMQQAREGALARNEAGEAEVEGRVAGAEVGRGEDVRTYHEDEVALPGDEVETLQRILYREGFLHVPPSGIVDPQTREALRSWQTAQGWEPTGSVDARSVKRLMGDRAADVPQGLDEPGSDRTGGPGPGEGPEGSDGSGEGAGEALP